MGQIQSYFGDWVDWLYPKVGLVLSFGRGRKSRLGRVFTPRILEGFRA
jgi:hypothetical protein